MQSQRVRRPEGPQDWEAQRAVITDLYITKGLELEDLMKAMEEEHFFKATKKQYKTYFTKWDLRKNVRPSEYNAIVVKKRKREEEGKGSVFRLRGAVVNDSKIVRYEKKRTAGEEHQIAEAGTPDDLSCFTPSPIPSSPSAPSPVLPRSPFLNLFRVLIDSLMPSAQLLFSEAPNHGVHWTFSEILTSLVECVAFVDWESLELEIRSQKSEIMYDIDTLASRTLEDLEIGMSYRRLDSSFLRRVSSLVACVAQQLPFFRMRQPALFSLLRIQEALARLTLASIDLAIRNFLISLRISDITTTNDVGGGANAFEISVAALGRQIVVNFSGPTTKDLEQMHNSPLRRSESCESVRSIDSFLSDPVVDWKDLLYGYNP